MSIMRSNIFKPATIKKYILEHPWVFKFPLRLYNIFLGRNKFNIGKKNKMIIESAQCKKTKIRVRGVGNRIFISDLCRLNECLINITGNNNSIYLSERVSLNQTEFCMEDDNNEIRIGCHTSIQGHTHLAAIESTKIIIGEDCMFSSNIHFRTGDSHSIVDLSGKRVNYSEDIVLGNHVWVGTKVISLKGTVVPNNCVIGAGSLLSRKYNEENSIIAGIPSKVIKSGINWLRERRP